MIVLARDRDLSGTDNSDPSLHFDNFHKHGSGAKIDVRDIRDGVDWQNGHTGRGDSWHSRHDMTDHLFWHDMSIKDLTVQLRST